MSRAVLALVLAGSVTTSACVPAAVGCLVGGGVSLLASKGMHKDNCSGEGCVYTNLMAGMLALIGLGLVIGGGIALAVDEQ
jgi:hypothetical protein